MERQSLPEVYAIAMRLYGKLHKVDEVEELWGELLELECMNQILAQARINAAADNGDVDSVREALAYMQQTRVQVNELHLSSAIHACANSNDENRALHANNFFDEMLERRLNPNIVTYSSLVRSLTGSPRKGLLDLLDNMKAHSVTANEVFAESFMFAFLQPSGQPRNHRKHKDVLSDIRKLPTDDLKTAKAVLDWFQASGIALTRFCTVLSDELESLLQ